MASGILSCGGGACHAPRGAQGSAVTSCREISAATSWLSHLGFTQASLLQSTNSSQQHPLSSGSLPWPPFFPPEYFHILTFLLVPASSVMSSFFFLPLSPAPLASPCFLPSLCPFPLLPPLFLFLLYRKSSHNHPSSHPHPSQGVWLGPFQLRPGTASACHTVIKQVIFFPDIKRSNGKGFSHLISVAVADNRGRMESTAQKAVLHYWNSRLSLCGHTLWLQPRCSLQVHAPLSSTEPACMLDWAVKSAFPGS